VPFRPAADRVNPSKFYVLDARGGQAYTQRRRRGALPAAPTGLRTFPSTKVQLRLGDAVPWHRGRRLAHQLQRAHHSTDSGKSYEAIGRVTEAYALGFGKPAEGKTYPALYLIARSAT